MFIGISIVKRMYSVFNVWVLGGLVFMMFNYVKYDFYIIIFFYYLGRFRGINNLSLV